MNRVQVFEPALCCATGVCGEDVDQDSVYIVGKGGRTDQIPTHPAVWALAQTRPRRGWWFPTCSAAGHVTSLRV